MTSSTNRAAASATRSRQIVLVEVQRICRNGGTQARVRLDDAVVREYADLMTSGIYFPPVRAWFDGATYWLSDGFHRLAAADLVGMKRIATEVHRGSLEEATWDSYAANVSHGLRRNRADIEYIIENALRHPSGFRLSTSQIAKHLGIPETTLRRWKTILYPEDRQAGTRMAVRNGHTYAINVNNIGKPVKRHTRGRKSLSTLRAELESLKGLGSPRVLPLIGILEEWIFGDGSATICLERLEKTVGETSLSAVK